MDKHVPSQKISVWMLLIAGAVVILTFTGILRYTLRTAFPVNPADYTEPAPEGFTYTCTVTQQNGALAFSGYALVAGERFLQVDTAVVLYCAETGVSLKLPTAMAPDDAATAAISDGINYSFGGYYAFVREAQLKLPLSSYEICFAYRSSDHNALIHTGQSAEVTA